MDDPSITAEHVQLQSTFDRFGLFFAALLVILFMLLPMLAISVYSQDPSSNGLPGNAQETSVGIAVILRFAARRLLRTSSRNVLKTAFGTLSRTTGRTMLRRLVRVAIKTLLATGQQALRRSVKGDELEDDADKPQHPLVAVSLGYVALFLSFWFILTHVVSTEVSGHILQGMPAGLAAAMAAAPLLLYAAISHGAGRLWGVQVLYSTGADGLLLQAYFTGAGSFLPLTTDSEYVGEARAVQRVAMAVLLSNFAVFWAVLITGNLLGSYPLIFAAACILIYVFVFSFPIKPLDGHYIWQRSKLLWLLVFVPVLTAFALYLPEALNDIL